MKDPYTTPIEAGSDMRMHWMRPLVWLAVGALILLAGGVVGWVQWRLSLNASGYCEKTATYNDDKTILRLAIANELQFMSAQGKALDGKSLKEVKEEGRVLRSISTPAYSSVEDFLHHNSLETCCRLGQYLGEGDKISIGIRDQLSGFHRGLVIKWASPYLEENGTKVFVGEGDKPSELLLFAFDGAPRKYGASVLLVSNCGETREGWDEQGRYGGRL